MTAKSILIVALLALAVAACSAGSDDDPDTGELPLDPAAGACLEGDPDCNDIPGQEPDPLLQDDEPDLSQQPGDVSGGMVTTSGLSVADAIASDTGGVMAITGFIVENDTGARICDALAESFPPQCGGASLSISSLEAVDPEDLRTEQGVTWTDQPVTVLGDIVDDRLMVVADSA